MKLKVEKILKSRDLWLVVLILIYGFYSGLFGGLFGFGTDRGYFSKPARIEIDYGTERRAFEGEVFSGMSVLDALLAASRGGNFEIRYALLNDATDIMGIGGLIEDGLDAKRWHFYLNDEVIEASEIHKIKLESGDKISVKFE